MNAVTCVEAWDQGSDGSRHPCASCDDYGAAAMQVAGRCVGG